MSMLRKTISTTALLTLSWMILTLSPGAEARSNEAGDAASSAVSATPSTASQAPATDLQAIMSEAQQEIMQVVVKIQMNMPITSEEKAGNVLSAYAELMAIESKLLAAVQTQSQTVLPQFVSLLSSYNNNSSAGPAVQQADATLAQLAQTVEQLRQSVEQLSAKVDGLGRLGKKYPALAGKTSALISLTHSSITDTRNFSIEVAKILTSYRSIASAIAQSAPGVAANIEAMSGEVRGFETNSFSELEVKFRALQ